MSFDSLLNVSVEVRRATPSSPAAVDEWNQPTRAADTTIATVRARIEPLTLKEVALLTDAGAQIGDYLAFMRPTDVQTADRIRITSTTTQYEVRSILPIDASAAAHHLELLLRRVVH